MPRPTKEVSLAQRSKIVARYSEGWGLLTISKDIGHNVGVIRRVLVEEGLTIRHVGRPAKQP
jgi:hypothetical protein